MDESSNQQFLSLQETMPLFNPKYPPDYYQLFTQLKKHIQQKNFDSRANQLAQKLVPFGSSNYNCWYVKKMCFLNGATTYQNQMDFSEQTLLEKIKNFQLWEHRRFLSEYSKGKFANQYALINKVLKIEPKNYHAWSYRIWIVDHVQNYTQQIQFTHKLIKDDPYNNSLWSYRFHIVNKMIHQQENPKNREQMLFIQILQTLMILQKCLNNEAGWNYLRGYFPSIKLQGIPSTNQKAPVLIKSYQQIPRVLQFVRFQIQKLQKQMSTQNFQLKNYHLESQVQLLITLVHILSQQQENIQYAKNNCFLLVEKDKQKKYYWKWIAQNLDLSN